MIEPTDVMLFAGVLIGYGAHALKCYWDRKEEEKKRLKRIWTLVEISVVSNRYVERAGLPELTRAEDLVHERMN